MGPRSEARMLIDPNGWEPTPEDVDAIAKILDLHLEDGTLLPMDDTLIRFAATRMEHEGGIGKETYTRTARVYEDIKDQADKTTAELAQAYMDNNSELEPSMATDLAHAEVYAELTSKAAHSITGVNSGEDT